MGRQIPGSEHPGHGHPEESGGIANGKVAQGNCASNRRGPSLARGKRKNSKIWRKINLLNWAKIYKKKKETSGKLATIFGMDYRLWQFVFLDFGHFLQLFKHFYCKELHM